MIGSGRRQTQPAERAIRRINQGSRGSQDRARIHSTGPRDIHQRMRRSGGSNVVLQPIMHLMSVPARAILAQQPRDTKANSHMHLSGPDAATNPTNIIPIHANGVNTPRNLLQIKGIAGNNASVVIIHTRYRTNAFGHSGSFLLVVNRHILHYNKTVA